MSLQRPPTDIHSEREDAEADPVVEDLERRIDELDGLDGSAFGEFTRVDWWICIVGALIIPHIALWWAAG